MRRRRRNRSPRRKRTKRSPKTWAHRAQSIAAPVAGYEMASAARAGAPCPGRKPARHAPANDVINERGYWQGLPSAEPVEVPSTSARARRRLRLAPGRRCRRRRRSGGDRERRSLAAGRARRNEPMPNALAYASQPTPIAAARAMPMGTGTPRAAPAASPATPPLWSNAATSLPDAAHDDRCSGVQETGNSRARRRSFQ